MAAPQSAMTLHHVSQYSFGVKAPKFEKDNSVQGRMDRLREKYAREGTRRSVDAVLLVHEHGAPHVLLLQVGAAFFRLPGGRLRPGEGAAAGLLRKLAKALGPEAEGMRPDWQVGELLATFYRPNFDNAMYPYCPPHVARPKEVRSLFAVRLPERAFLAVPKNHRLIAVPLFEVYDHVSRYGPVIAALPAALSRFSFVLAARADAGGAAPAAAAPAGAAGAGAAAEQQALAVRPAPPPAVEAEGGGGGNGGGGDDLVIEFD